MLPQWSWAWYLMTMYSKNEHGIGCGEENIHYFGSSGGSHRSDRWGLSYWVEGHSKAPGSINSPTSDPSPNKSA